jgi:hypothetical protein
MTKRHRALHDRAPALRRLPLAALALALSACGAEPAAKQDGAPDPGSVAQCVSTRQLFAEQVWPKVMAKKCINCHAPGGLAAERHAGLKLYPTSYPGFLEQNLVSLRELSKTEYEGQSLLLRKPMGELDHGGGVQFGADSDDYRLMADLVSRLQGDNGCEVAVATPPVQGVEAASALQLFRKASLLLAGRLPRPDESQQLRTTGETALPGMLDALMREPGFHEWLLVTFNDELLTDRYLGDSTNTLRREDFPNVAVYLADTVPELDKRKYRRSVAREPLELIAYVVENDRPFTEILTADYTLLNAYSAQIYNDTSLQFDDPTDETDYKPGKIHAVRDGVRLAFPHAGILSSPMFLNRFPTSPTNRNRHRAKVILEKFLATDILKVADRPIDPTQAVALANPTREDPACSVCHSMLDPLAGAFMKFSDNDPEQLVPNREWYKEMFLPGFGQEVMQVAEYPRSLPWVAQRIAADPRFPLAVVNNAYRALTNQEPLAYPADGEAGALAAWQAQDATFRAIAGKLVAANFNYKVVIRELLLSPYLRASNISVAGLQAHAGELAAYGSLRLSSPESLSQKLFTTLGFHWVRYDRQPALTSTYDILYGGIDSDAVTERLVEPNGVMSAVMSRMAIEAACQATAWDFLKPADQRLLFPQVEPSDTPASAAARIRANIRHLHAHLLGEELPEGSPELERTYRLFDETWQQGTALLATPGGASKALPNACRGRWNRLTGEELPEGQRLEEDKDYTLRSWMAVVTYLLSDFRFLYE